MPRVGEQGQSALLNRRVLVVGAGGLGSPAAMYLAAAWVGFLRIIDPDSVELSNLQRQLLYRTKDIGESKAACARATLTAINPDVTVEALTMRFTPENACDCLQDVDFVIEATDSAVGTFAVAGACHDARLPYCYGGLTEFGGQVMTVLPGRTACIRCLFGSDVQPAAIDAESPPGPLSPVPGIVGSTQAAEAVKFLIGIGTLLVNRLLIVDALGMSFRTVPVRPSADCPVCGGCSPAISV